jgi:hypothetical protein
MKLFILLFITFSAFSAPSEKWEGDVPRLAQDAKRWIEFTDYLSEKKMYYGVLAASYRMILFFDDFETKKKAFENLVNLIDLGYAHGLSEIFFVGDLDMSSRDNFSQNYNFYKAVINKIKKMEKWSEDFFKRVDQENFYKYQFYQAINLYKDKKLIEALDVVDKILQKDFEEKDFSFVKKVVRTKARILFERKEYSKSLELYDDFLLKVNPIGPYDWLEKAWNLYYLKKYDIALGALFNLEAPSAKKFPTFEKYILRASIYLNNCLVNNVDKLVENFEKEFNYSINGIINGKPLGKLRQLREIAKNMHPRYMKVLTSVENLKNEYKAREKFPGKFRALGRYLYISEHKMLRQYSKFYEEDALKVAAERLTMLAESLKFLGYSTAREKYNPLTVFIPREDESESLVEQIDLEKRGFVFNWKQIGGFWRDERNIYYGDVKSRCD